MLINKFINVVVLHKEEFISDFRVNEEYINFYNFDNENEIDLKLPTLYVGYFNTKKIYGENLDILVKQISPNVIWTFTKEERLVDYFEVGRSFFSNIFTLMSKNYEYHTMNNTFLKLPDIKHVLYNIRCIIDITKIYVNTRSIFIYDGKRNIIYGIDRYYFMFIDKKYDDEILKYLKPNKNYIYDKENTIKNKLINDFSDSNNSDILEKYIVTFLK